LKIIKPFVLIPKGELDSVKVQNIERYGRICYKSENLITVDSAERFVTGIIKSGHESVIEHEKATVIITCDRGVTHEIVRHRIGSYSQESTRYCNYSKEKFGQEITVIEPYFYDNSVLYRDWYDACVATEAYYMSRLEPGSTPQEARSILPNSLKTEIVVTFNMREWRHFFKLRCSAKAHPQMRQVAIPLLLKFQECLPALFADVDYDRSFPVEHYAEIRESDPIIKENPDEGVIE